jgi:hypothetical protein
MTCQALSARPYGVVAAVHFSLVLGVSTGFKSVLAIIGGAATFAG